MGKFNEILAGRFNRFTQKHFSMKGREGTPTLSADVQMGMDFNSGVENRYLESWDVFARSGTIALFAGNAATAEIRNPAASGVVAVIFVARMWEVTADPLAAGLTYYPGATVDQASIVGSARPLDSRSGRLSSSCIVSANPGAAFTSPGGAGAQNVQVGPLAANGLFDMGAGIEVPLLPGNAYTLSAGTVAQAIFFAWMWRERALEDSEKF